MEPNKKTATFLLRGKRIDVASGQTIRDALRKTDLATEALLAVREGILLTDDHILRPGDEVKLVAVISGG